MSPVQLAKPLSLISIGSLMAGLSLFSASSAAQNRDYAYQVAWGHMALAEAQVSYHQGEDSYRLSSSGEAQGLLAFFFSWRGEAETIGNLKEGQRFPKQHRHKGEWEDRTRVTHVTWPENAPPRTQAEPTPDLTEVTPVPSEALTGTTDPFSFLLTVMDSLAEEGRCVGAAKIWDGRRRYDLEMVHLGQEELEADRPWSYGGPAIACSFNVERIGGFWREAGEWREAQDNSANPPKVWAAEVTPGQWSIVRAEIETPYGAVIARLLPEGGLEGDS